MDHLTIFNPDTRAKCKTDFKKYSTSVKPVGRHTNRKDFNEGNFDEFSFGSFDDLLAKGPANCWDRNKFSSTADFLQSWLFFSLISKVLCKPISIKDFVQDNSNYIHTRELPRLLREWQPDQIHYTAINRALERANDFVSKWCDRLDPQWGIPQELWLSIAILGETLTHAQLKTITQKSGPSWQKARERRWGSSQYLEDVVEQKGWCRSTARMLSTAHCALSGLYVAALLPPPMVPVSARQALVNQDVADQDVADQGFHSNCDPFLCTANLVEEEKFPLHLEGGCVCRSLQPNFTKIASILKRGNIPVIRVIQKEGDGIPYVDWPDVQEFNISGNFAGIDQENAPDRREPFVALSHVWSDGLGNHKSNSLPFCRLRQIQDMVNELCDEDRTGDMLFWIDTLCVPWQKGSLRSQAIRLMNAVYRHAYKVLVLDEDLRQFSGYNGLEPLIRITMSKWVRRLWTLQEGIVCDPDRLSFKFNEETTLSVTKIDSIINAAEGNLHLAWIECPRIFNPAVRNLSYFSKGKALEASNTTERIANLWQAVQWRASQRESDETICLASLLDLPVEPLLELPEKDEQRMCKFLTLLDESWLGIPAGLIFLPGPKLQTAGFRWAVKTWMGSVPREYPYPLSLKHKLTHLTTRGLLVACAGLRLEFASAFLPQTPFYTRVWEGSATTDFGEPPHDNWIKIELIGEKYRFSQAQERANGTNGMLSKNVVLMLSRGIPQTRPELALLVYITKEKEVVKWVQTISRVWVTQITSHKHREELEEMQGRNEGGVCSAEHIKDNQYWCVEGGVDPKRMYEKHDMREPGPHLGAKSRSFVLETVTRTTGVVIGTVAITRPAQLVGLSSALARPPKRKRK